MNIRVIFGYLFFLLSIIFGCVQLITLSMSDHLEVIPLILQFFPRRYVCCSLPLPLNPAVEPPLL